MTNFIEDYRGENAPEESFSEFGWDELYDQLGETEDSREEFAGVARRQSVRFAVALVDWLLGDTINRHTIHNVGLRALAMAWVIQSRHMEDFPQLHTLAQKLNFAESNISPLTAEFSARFGIRRPEQKHDWRHHDERTDRNKAPKPIARKRR